MYQPMFIFLVIVSTQVYADVIVELPNGKIRGFMKTTHKNNTYYSFKNIPYAKPPTGELRFKAPQPAQNWEGVLNGTTLDVSCYQLSPIQGIESEDCLYLSVYTPQVKNGTLVPVMVYIHGGGFVDGTSINVQSDNLIDEGVILVAMNYRLGPFGFLSTEDGVIPGNFGLKDQQLALKWTHDNIRKFAGDPEKIVIFGHSAGAASVAYHLLSDKSKGLFQGAICQSGTFLCPWAYQRNAREASFTVAGFLNHSITNKTSSDDLLKFLQSVPAEKIKEGTQFYYNLIFSNTSDDFAIYEGLNWAPVIELSSEEAFLTRKMFTLLQEGQFVKVPTILGFTSEENLGLHTDSEKFQQLLQLYDQELDSLIPFDMQISDKMKRLEMGAAIREIYTQGKPFSENLGDGMRFSSDNSFTRSIIKHAELASKFTKIYLYQFSYDGDLGGFHVNYEGAENVTHGEELNYLFCEGSKCDLSHYPTSDKLTQERLVKLWTNFAKYLNPTPAPLELFQNLTWPLVSPNWDNLQYLDIAADLIIKKQPKMETYRRWNELYDSLGYTDLDTY